MPALNKDKVKTTETLVEDEEYEMEFEKKVRDKKKKLIKEINCNTFIYTRALLEFTGLITYKLGYNYRITYLCHANPKVFIGKDFKTYYCRPILAISERNEERKVIDHDEMKLFQKEYDINSIVISENKKSIKFKKEPNKPFLLKVEILRKTFKGKSYYTTVVDQETEERSSEARNNGEAEEEEEKDDERLEYLKALERK
jgi:hypothetical protein